MGLILASFSTKKHPFLLISASDCGPPCVTYFIYVTAPFWFTLPLLVYLYLKKNSRFVFFKTVEKIIHKEKIATIKKYLKFFATVLTFLGLGLD